MAVGVHDSAIRSVLPPPELPLDADVLSTNRTESLDERGMRVELGVGEPGNEAVAALAHSLDLRAVEREVKLVLVGLGDPYKSSS